MLLLRNSWDPYHERPGLNVCRDWIILSVLEVRIKCQWGQIQISPVALFYRCPLQGRMFCVVLLDRVLHQVWNWSECRCRTGAPSSLEISAKAERFSIRWMLEISFLSITGKEPCVSYYFAFLVIPNYHCRACWHSSSYLCSVLCGLGNIATAMDWILDLKKKNNKAFCVASRENRGLCMSPSAYRTARVFFWWQMRCLTQSPLQFVEVFSVISMDSGCRFCGFF